MLSVIVFTAMFTAYTYLADTLEQIALEKGAGVTFSYGGETDAFLRRFSADIALIGASGLLPEGPTDAESRAADSAREREDLSWKDWAKRLQKYYTLLDTILQPDLIVVGGGVSKKHEKFLPLLELRTTIVPAELRNEAGIIGAAVMAAESEQR